jgi:hypothetical protein
VRLLPNMVTVLIIHPKASKRYGFKKRQNLIYFGNVIITKLKEINMSEKINLTIILGSVRIGRFGEWPAKMIKEVAEKMEGL